MVFINIVSWNGMKYLPDALKSIFNQTYKDFSVLVIDNGSTDGTVDFLRAEYPQVSILKNSKNLGFAGAHNQGIKFVFNLCEKNNLDLEKNYMLITNPDIVLTPNFLEKIILRADNHSDGASFGGKILKIFNDDMVSCPTETIDSVGLKVFKNRRIAERGSGEGDAGQYNGEEEIFGFSDMLVLYRLSVFKNTEIKNGYFDSKYLNYKEDIDLAWRLRIFGWKSFYIGSAVAYHFRGVYESEKRNLKVIIRERKAKKGMINYYATSNHLFTILKNDFLVNFLKDSPRIFFYELSKFFYILFFEIKSLGAYLYFVKNFFKVWETRKEVMSRIKIDSGEIRKWFY